MLQCCSSCVEDIKDILLSAIQITLKYFDGESILANNIAGLRGTLLIYYENDYLFLPEKTSYRGSVQDFLERSTRI